MKNGFTLLLKKFRDFISTASSRNDGATLYAIKTKRDQGPEVETGAVVRFLAPFAFIKNKEQQKNNNEGELISVNDELKKVPHQQVPVRSLKPYNNYPHKDEKDYKTGVNDDLAQCSSSVGKHNIKTASNILIRTLVSFSIIKNTIPHINKTSFMKILVPRSVVFAIVFAILNLLLADKSFSQTQTFNYTGSNQTFTVPAGVTSITVECWGAGGAGGGPGSGSFARAGGGGGAYIIGTITTIPGTNYTVVIGHGGQSSTNNGTATTFGGASLFSADFGRGGGSSGSTPGNPGTAGASVITGSATGVVKTSGIIGGDRNNPAGGDGGDAGNTTGTGGAGGAANNNGSPGTAPGGGGGGAGTNGSGGSGANGKVIVTWTVPCPTITYTTVINEISCFEAGDGIITVNSVSGGTPAYMYSIDNGANYQVSNVFENLVPDQYKIRVKDANGCESKSVQ